MIRSLDCLSRNSLWRTTLEIAGLPKKDIYYDVFPTPVSRCGWFYDVYIERASGLSLSLKIYCRLGSVLTRVSLLTRKLLISEKKIQNLFKQKKKRKILSTYFFSIKKSMGVIKILIKEKKNKWFSIHNTSNVLNSRQIFKCN